MYETILVPTDGSPAASRAAEEAFDVAREFGATVHVLYVVDESASSFLFADESMATVLEALTEEGEGATAEVAALADDVPVETAVVRGVSIDESIVDYAREQGVDLVVMGRQGRQGVEHLLGSTTERVLARAGVPVLVVSANGAEGEAENETGDEDDA